MSSKKYTIEPDELHDLLHSAMKSIKLHPEPSDETLRFFKEQKEINKKFEKFCDSTIKLETIVEQGFRTTHEKLDYTNGTVKKNKEWIENFDKTYMPTVQRLTDTEKTLLKRIYTSIVTIGFWVGLILVVIGLVAQKYGT